MAIQSKTPVKFIHVSLGSTTPKSLIDLGFTDAQIRLSDIAIITPQSQGVFYTIVDPESIKDGLGVLLYPTTSAGHYIPVDTNTTIISRALLRNLLLIAETGTTNVSITLLGL